MKTTNDILAAPILPTAWDGMWSRDVKIEETKIRFGQAQYVITTSGERYVIEEPPWIHCENQILPAEEFMRGFKIITKTARRMRGRKGILAKQDPISVTILGIRR